jgi:hypothetical protein
MYIRPFKKSLLTSDRCWWLRPVIPATEEAQIRRITVQSQPGQTVLQTLPQKTYHTHTHKNK